MNTLSPFLSSVSYSLHTRPSLDKCLGFLLNLCSFLTEGGSFWRGIAANISLSSAVAALMCRHNQPLLLA